MCPISPAAPAAPLMISSLMITPPPTPVPSVTITELEYSFAAPIHDSPSAATFASFPALTLRPPRHSENSFSTLNTPQPRFTQRFTTPSSDTGPGIPIPTPATSSDAMFFSSIFLITVCARSLRMFTPPFDVSVGTSHFSSSSPSAVNKPHLHVVPPRSNPNPYFAISFKILHITSIQLVHPLTQWLLLSLYLWRHVEVLPLAPRFHQRSQ